MRLCFLFCLVHLSLVNDEDTSGEQNKQKNISQIYHFHE